MLESPKAETIGYIRDYITTVDIAILVFAGICIFLTFRSQTTHKPIQKNTKRWLWGYLLISCASTLILFKISAVDDHPFFCIPKTVILAYERKKEILARQESIIGRFKNTTACTSEFLNIIVVLGESASKNKMSVYGYNKNTTPFANSISPLALDAISPSNQTRLSIPIMLTNALAKTFYSSYSTPSIVTELGDCGYQTHWISNQAKNGRHDGIIGSIGEEAANSVFLNSTSLNPEVDEKLLPEIKKLTTTNVKNAIFVHLAGSHFEYAARYPKGFAKTQPTTLENEYEESIAYTDSILMQIFKLFENKKLLLIYVSDHGEVIGAKNGKEIHGHGFSPSYKDEYEIPFLIWPAQDPKVGLLKNMTEGKRINTESFDSILRFMVGLDSSPNISYSQDVISLNPDNIVNYSLLPRAASTTNQL